MLALRERARKEHSSPVPQTRALFCKCFLVPMATSGFLCVNFEKKKCIVCSFYPGKLALCWQITFGQLGCNLKHVVFFLGTLNHKVFAEIDSYFSLVFLCISFQWIQEANQSAKYSLYFSNDSEIFPHLKTWTQVSLIAARVKGGVRTERELLSLSDSELNPGSATGQLCGVGQVFQHLEPRFPLYTKNQK